MRWPWLLLPVLLGTGCAGLDPAEAYRAAARSLNFKLEGVHPRMDLQFPLDRSGLVLGVDLGVENPSGLRLAARTLGGTVHLEGAQGSFPLGVVSFPGGAVLEPASRKTLRAEIRLPYGDLRSAWKLLEGVALRGQAGTWRLEGKATMEVLGLPFELPLRASRRTGSASP
ncbi:MAG: hypothetical protein HY823_12690 [Acidobacteria bacterium]|nr:hypothetical protein [Acidobacteriota bacterium]